MTDILHDYELTELKHLAKKYTTRANDQEKVENRHDQTIFKLIECEGRVSDLVGYMIAVNVQLDNSVSLHEIAMPKVWAKDYEPHSVHKVGLFDYAVAIGHVRFVAFLILCGINLNALHKDKDMHFVVKAKSLQKIATETPDLLRLLLERHYIKTDSQLEEVVTGAINRASRFSDLKLSEIVPLKLIFKYKKITANYHVIPRMTHYFSKSCSTKSMYLFQTLLEHGIDYSGIMHNPHPNDKQLRYKYKEVGDFVMKKCRVFMLGAHNERVGQNSPMRKLGVCVDLMEMIVDQVIERDLEMMKAKPNKRPKV